MKKALVFAGWIWIICAGIYFLAKDTSAGSLSLGLGWLYIVTSNNY